jgi:hypothetical protein
MVNVTADCLVLGLFSALVTGVVVGMALSKWIYRGVGESIDRIYQP